MSLLDFKFDRGSVAHAEKRPHVVGKVVGHDADTEKGRREGVSPSNRLAFLSFP